MKQLIYVRKKQDKQTGEKDKNRHKEKKKTNL